MTTEVREITPEDEASYRRFVEGHPHALVYHTRDHQRFLERLLGCRDATLVAVESDRVVGALPAVRTEGPIGYEYNSLPFFGTPGGALAYDRDIRTRLGRAFIERSRAESSLGGTLIENPLGRWDELEAEADFLDDRISMFTPLSRQDDRDEAFDAIMSKIDSSARRNVRKARKEGVAWSVENGSDGFAVLRDLHHEAMAAIGGTTRPASFFELVPECFEPGEQYELLVARHEDRPIAALLVFFQHLVAEYYMPTVDRDHGDLQGGPFLILQAMTRASLRGQQWFNWGGTWRGQKGLRRFKSKFGAVEGTYRYFCFLRSPASLPEKETLQEEYPYFYVLPYSELEEESE